MIQYGPILVRHRVNQAPTIATGRRNKSNPTTEQSLAEREERLIKNRLAARNLKRTRDEIETKLGEQLAELENERLCLEMQYEQLENRKNELSRAVYNVRQAPLIPLLVDLPIPIIFRTNGQSDLSIDIRPLLKSVSEFEGDSN